MEALDWSCICGDCFGDLPERFYSDIFTYMYVSLKRMFMQGLQYTPVLFSYSSITQTN